VLRIISLGAGVQSSAMALMAAHGVLRPMPQAAVFADTGWEPAAVYRWLRYLEARLPFPVLRVSNGSIREDLIRNARGETVGKRSATPPLFTLREGRPGMLWRQCTSAYKVEPVHRMLRRMLGIPPGKPVPEGTLIEVWLGISVDEAHRQKPASEHWVRRRWPLLEAGFRRDDCLAWLRRHGYPAPPKSSCIGCPYHSDAEWRRIKADPEAWASAVAVDRLIRGGLRGTPGPLFLHRSCRPLEEVPLGEDQMDLFGEECEGFCGL